MENQVSNKVHFVIDEFTVMKDGRINFPSAISETMCSIEPRLIRDSDLLIETVYSGVTENMKGFIIAWFEALKLRGVTKITIDTIVKD